MSQNSQTITFQYNLISQNSFYCPYKSLPQSSNFSIWYRTAHNWNTTCTSQSSNIISYHKTGPTLITVHKIIKINFEQASRRRISKHIPSIQRLRCKSPQPPRSPEISNRWRNGKLPLNNQIFLVASITARVSFSNLKDSVSNNNLFLPHSDTNVVG